MIVIRKPYVLEQDGKAYLKASVTISDAIWANWQVNAPSLLPSPPYFWRLSEDYPPHDRQNSNFGLWFSVPTDYKKYFSYDRGDAFVIALLFFAFITSSPIFSEAPVSKTLLHNINNVLIPQLTLKKAHLKKEGVRVMAHTILDGNSSGGVGTGMSCGIDSLYTFKKYTDASVADSDRLTHLIYLDMGAVFCVGRNKTLAEHNCIAKKIALTKFENAKKVGEFKNLPVVLIESNMDRDIYRGGYGYSAVYRNCSMISSIQKLFKTYYCSSLGIPTYKSYDICSGSEAYENLLCQVFSTRNTHFVLSDTATRYEKTSNLADEEYAQHYLDVCYNFNTCGRCAKCRRTMIALDLLGKLDKFTSIFDLEKFKREKKEIYDWMVKMNFSTTENEQTLQCRELYKIAKEKGYI